MSEESSRKIAEAVNGFEQLSMAEVNAMRYNVLSWRNDSVTAHEVDLRAMTCTCKDEEYNREDPEVCAHLAYALYQAPQTPDMTEAALWSLVNHHDRILASPPRDGTDAVTTDPEPSEATQAEVEEAVEEAAADLDRVDTARDFLETGFAQPEAVEIWVTAHDGINGVALDIDKRDVPDHVFESFKGLINSLDESTYHMGWADEPCGVCGESDGEGWYHIPDSRLKEWADAG